jgi:ATP-binding cassette subfamily C protein
MLNNIGDLTTDTLLYHYLPLFLVINFASEVLGYFLRKYAEAFRVMYLDYARIRFFNTFATTQSYSSQNYSKEKILTLIEKYIEYIRMFLREWPFILPAKLTQFVLILAILFFQSPAVLGINILVLGAYFTIGYYFSKRMSAIQARYESHNINTSSQHKNFFLNINSLKRLRKWEYFVNLYKENILGDWSNFKDVRQFHATRWFVQLNIFNLIYVFTLAIGIYQIIQGQLALGFIVLIKYSYDSLWGVMQYILEYFVLLVEQREIATIMRGEINSLLTQTNTGETPFPNKWGNMFIHDLKISYTRENDQKVEVAIPKLQIPRGKWIGIVGESGSGKSTILNVLLKQIEYTGEIQIDGKQWEDIKITSKDLCVISNTDSLFPVTFQDNILMGEDIPQDEFEEIANGLTLNEFITNYDDRLGHNKTTLSAGQMQRMRIARGVAQNAQIYLMDEPFNGIDATNKSRIIDYLKIKLAGKTVIFISHIKQELEGMGIEEIHEFKNSVLS